MLRFIPYYVVNDISSLSIFGETYNQNVSLLICETEGSPSFFRGACLISKKLIQSFFDHLSFFLMFFLLCNIFWAISFEFCALNFLAMFYLLHAIHTLLTMYPSEISDILLFITRTITLNWLITYIEHRVNQDYLHVLSHESCVSRLGLKFNHI